MVYLRIEDKTLQSKALVELLKTMSFVKILEEHQPNNLTRETMSQAEDGEVEYYNSAKDLLDYLKK